VDGEGHITDDPCKVLEDGGLLCLGGSEETGGYKGYGLSMMVEILGGILSGGPFGRHIRYWKNDPRPAKYVSFNNHAQIECLPVLVLPYTEPNLHCCRPSSICSQLPRQNE
jgi:hypothetical protein